MKTLRIGGDTPPQSTRSHARFRLVAILVASAVLLSACASGGSSSGDGKTSGGLTKLNVIISSSSTALPLVVAAQHGYFKKNGLDVSWKGGTGSLDTFMSTLGHQSDIVTGTQAALIVAAKAGLPVVAINGAAYDSSSKELSNVVAGAKSGITSYSDLAGKRVGSLSLTGNVHYAVLDTLQKAGVDTKSIHWVVGTVASLPDQLKAGRVDAIEEVEPFASLAVNSGGTKIGDPFRTVDDKVYQVTYLSAKSWADSHKDVVLKFGKALDEAAGWVKAHPDDARKTIGSYTGLTGAILEANPIPDFHFSTTAADLRDEQTRDINEWLGVLDRVASFKQGDLTAAQLIPSWAK
jgi:NitT/TauT family transport system substrate-binding protein